MMDIEKEEPEDDGVDVEIVDDTPEKDRGREALPDDKEPDTPSDEEIEAYSEKVQKRIKELTFQIHDQRRKREKAEREGNAALDFAKTAMTDKHALQEELENWKKTVADGETVLIEQAKGRYSAELEAAKRAYKEAYDSGDSEKLAELGATMASAAAEKVRVEAYQPQEYVPQKIEVPKMPEINIPEPDERALEWQNKNEWFNKDSAMTGYAFGLHQDLITKQNISPSSDEYYEKIDEGMKKTFPSYFNSDDEEHEEQEDKEPSKRKKEIVASATRSGKSSRKIRLTQSQLSIAKRLGVTPEQYAAQVVKDRQT